MITAGKQAKKRLQKVSDDSEVWDFLDHQPNNGSMPPLVNNAANPNGQIHAGQSHAAPHGSNNGASHGGFDSMLLEYWDQPNEMQLNIRLPAGAKKMIERLARRKTVGVSTLVRMWVIESLRREARQL